jgi:hypothetical protein
VPITASEQEMFDSALDLEEKIQFLKQEMILLVDQGKLTKIERKEVIEQIKSRPAMTESIKARLEKVEREVDLPSHRISLVQEDVLAGLWRRLASVEKLAEKAGPKGRWNSALTPAEVKLLGDKEEWDAQVAQLVAQSKMWFETDEELNSRVLLAKSALLKGKQHVAAVTALVSTTKAKPATSAPPPSASAWKTVKPVSSTKSASTGVGKSVSNQKKNVFAGLGDDSD